MKKFKFKGLKFLFFVIALLILLAVFDFENIAKIMDKVANMLYRLIPIFILVIVITALINYFLKPKKIMKYFGKDSGKKGILYALLGGIISHGPMYAWYPMLDDMRKHGLKFGLIAIFMYARAVKIPLLPFMIGLFGLPFTIIANIYILIFAVLQGKVIDLLISEKKR
ncbi:MAG: permease [Campylobacteraceae bacterium]|nr:permease [Campylobacteraceae bacterium]